jgi:hypothetical protein
MFKQDIIHGNRRSDCRYELQLELRFSYESLGATCIGSGYTIDLSHGGIRFWTDAPPPIGQPVELRIKWPFLLQGVCPLELLVRGTVLRTGFQGSVVKLTKYEFRTCGHQSFDQATGVERACGFYA